MLFSYYVFSSSIMVDTLFGNLLGARFLMGAGTNIFWAVLPCAVFLRQRPIHLGHLCMTAPRACNAYHYHMKLM